MNDEPKPEMTKEEFEQTMVDLMDQVIDQKKVARALKSYLEEKIVGQLNGPEVIKLAALLLASVVMSCPSEPIALKLFLKCLTQELPQLTVLVESREVDPAPSRSK